MNPPAITLSNTFPKNKEAIILGIDMNNNSNINCIIICILDGDRFKFCVNSKN